ncbi:MAG: acyltransferase family protein [Janthinobacterium lividum]
MTIAAPKLTVSAAPRIDYVDALRGLACLFVVMYHFFDGKHPYDIHPWLDAHPQFPFMAVLRIVFSYGAASVPLFLALSGFCLFWPVARKYPLPDVRVDFFQFIQRRARRILPPYYIALLGFVLYERIVPGQLTAEYPSGGVKVVIEHILMLQNFSLKAFAATNSVFWSLAVEWQMYLAFPLFLWVIRRGGEKWGLPLLVAASLLVAAAWSVFSTHKVGQPIDWREYNMWHASPLDYCWYFALGMASAYLVANPHFRTLRAWVTGLGLAAFLPAIYLTPQRLPFAPESFFWGLGFVGLLVGTSYVKTSIFQPRGWLHSLTWFGTCSYSMYLVHGPIIVLMERLVGARLALIITLPIVIVAGYLFHLAFERPFMNSKPGVKIRTEAQAEIAAVESPAP